ncbi:MAG: NUDIX hydrolase [Armatimonadota bacterium]|nr:NUDIX hydrolase [Armatimonadota bacterium]
MKAEEQVKAEGQVKAEEQILVVPREALLPEPLVGFHPGDGAAYVERVRRWGTYRRRGDVEEDPTLKQVIPYLIVRHRDRIFLFQRLRSGAEHRLHGLYSIGVGGHIARQDGGSAGEEAAAAEAAGADVLQAGLARELQEELVVRPPWRARLVGVLNEEDTPVSRVHFGLVYLVEVEDPAVRVRETDRLSGRLAAREEVRAAYPAMETWSRRILDAVDPFTL